MSRLSRAGGSRKVPVRYSTPSASSAALALGIAAHKRGRWREAQGAYEQRLVEEPQCLDAWVNLGSLHAWCGRGREAEQAFSVAAGLGNSNARALRDIGLGLKTVGRLNIAAKLLERAVAVDPALVGAWLHLARLRLETEHREDAERAARRALELKPHDASALLLLAQCLMVTGRMPPEGLEALARCAQAPSGRGVPRWTYWLFQRRAEPEGRTLGLTGPSPCSPQVGETPELEAFADAMAYLDQEMPQVRLCASRQELLRVGVDRATHTGNLVELGVFHGSSLRCLASLWPSQVHGFDTFTGLPSDWAPVSKGRFSTGSRLPDGIDARYWMGTFEEQLPRFLEHSPAPVAFLHVDSDLYESAACGLTLLAPRLKRGAIIIFDEYFGHRSWRNDEFRAFAEAVKREQWSYEYLAANPFTGQVAIRLL